MQVASINRSLTGRAQVPGSCTRVANNRSAIIVPCATKPSNSDVSVEASSSLAVLQQRAKVGAVSLALALGIGALSPEFLPPAVASDDSSLSPYERRKAQMERRKELLANTRRKAEEKAAEVVGVDADGSPQAASTPAAAPPTKDYSAMMKKSIGGKSGAIKAYEKAAQKSPSLSSANPAAAVSDKIPALDNLFGKGGDAGDNSSSAAKSSAINTPPVETSKDNGAKAETPRFTAPKLPSFSAPKFSIPSMPSMPSMPSTPPKPSMPDTPVVPKVEAPSIPAPPPPPPKVEVPAPIPTQPPPPPPVFKAPEAPRVIPVPVPAPVPAPSAGQGDVFEKWQSEKQAQSAPKKAAGATPKAAAAATKMRGKRVGALPLWLTEFLLLGSFGGLGYLAVMKPEVAGGAMKKLDKAIGDLSSKLTNGPRN